jgi:hypothetical protein
MKNHRHYHQLHVLGHVWSVPSFWRLCWFFHLKYGHPLFRHIFGFYVKIFFWIRLSSISRTCHFPCDLDFRMLLFRLKCSVLPQFWYFLFEPYLSCLLNSSRIPSLGFEFLLVFFCSPKFGSLCKYRQGRAIAQAVSRRLPTAAARVQTKVWSCGILWWTKVALGQVFSENFGFPANLHSICFSKIIFTITRGWHNRPGVAAVPIASQTK